MDTVGVDLEHLQHHSLGPDLEAPCRMWLVITIKSLSPNLMGPSRRLI